MSTHNIGQEVHIGGDVYRRNAGGNGYAKVLKDNQGREFLAGQFSERDLIEKIKSAELRHQFGRGREIASDGRGG